MAAIGSYATQCYYTIRVKSILPSLERAPRKKKSQSDSTATTVAAPPAARRRLVRLAIKRFFSCSKTVYWIMGFMTRISAGPIPRQKALGKTKVRLGFKDVNMNPRNAVFCDDVLRRFKKSQFLHDYRLFARSTHGAHSLRCLDDPYRVADEGCGGSCKKGEPRTPA